MPKLLRDISGIKLAKLLEKYGYNITRQSGSHIRLTSNFCGEPHNITIPAHEPLKIGTLNNILKEIAGYLSIPKDELITKLFDKKV